MGLVMRTYIFKESPIVVERGEIYQVRCVETEAILGYVLRGFEEFPDCLEEFPDCLIVAIRAAKGKALFDDAFAP